MRHRMIKTGLLIAAFFGAAGIAGAAGAAPAQQPAPAGAAQTVVVAGQKNASKWFRAESQHFIVTSDTSNEDARLLLNNLEKLDYLLRAYTKNYRIDAGAQQKLSLYYHNRMASFNEVATGQPDEAVGLYNSCGAAVQGFAVHLEPIPKLADTELSKHMLNDSLSYIFEAYTRHFLYRYTDIRKPDAYVDGFALYFSSVRFSDTQVVIGRVPVSLRRYMHFLSEGHRYAMTYDDVLTHSLKDRGNMGAATMRLEYLSRSWLLTHYMLSSTEQFAKRDKYLDLVHHDVPAGDAFEQAFGLAPDKLGETMWRYPLKGIQVMQVNVPELPSAIVNFTSLPDSLTNLVLAEAALKSCPDRKTGEGLLRTVSNLAGAMTNSDAAQLTLSRAQIDWGNPSDALPYLSEATRKNPANAEALYLLGLANLRLAQQQPASSAAMYLTTAKAHLKSARHLAPRSAEAAFALYQAELGAAGSPDDAVLKGVIAAWRNAHEVSSYARAAALSFAYAGRGVEADNAFTLLAHDARDPALAAWAKNWQTRLSTGVSRADLLAEMRREPGAGTGFKEWTVAAGDLMQAVERKAGTEQLRDYLEMMQVQNPLERALGTN